MQSGSFTYASFDTVCLSVCLSVCVLVTFYVSPAKTRLNRSRNRLHCRGRDSCGPITYYKGAQITYGNGQAAFFLGGREHVPRPIVKYSDYAVLRCGCIISAAEILHSSAVGTATDESIRRRDGWRYGLLLWTILLTFIYIFNLYY